MDESHLSITELRSGDVRILSLAGRIDGTNAGNFAARLNQVLASGDKSIVLDFASVLYLTSAALRALLAGSDEARRRAARLVLCNLAAHIRELFEVSGLIGKFTVLGSRDDALAHLG